MTTASEAPHVDPLPAAQAPRTVLDHIGVPPLDALTADQARGAVCVWDAGEEPLTAESAVDLGERVTGVHWFPRACRAHAGRRAYQALLDHAPRCEQCVDDAGSCGTGLALYRLIREGVRP
ncbi:hypothetical protein ACIQNG_28045 [Streptomyces sp. NPDC091377]|uniref:hypothetical protein n=1 Tax=Streptomyces sp. NPDC091377 TaxID=3365995 RepID=UPI0038114DAE